MGSTSQVLRGILSPASLILVITAVLVVSAVKPSLASDQANSFLRPAADPAASQQLIVSPPEHRIPNANKVAGVSSGSQSTAIQTPKPPDCKAQPCIALSFDDGPSAKNTPAVLDILEQEKVTASFFLIGRNVPGNEALVKRMVASGFEIGNHTWDHKDLSKLTDDQIKQEILSTQAAIVQAGGPLPTYFRPPYGSADARVRAAAGLKTILWNEDPRDWDTSDPSQLVAAILASAKPGGVVDMHDIQSVTTVALRPAILALKQKGFQFVTISALMQAEETPTNPADPFFGLYRP